MIEGFNECEISYVPQKSDAWFELRKDKITASKVGTWFIDKGQSKRTLDARDKAIAELLAARKKTNEPRAIPNFEVGDPPPTSAHLWPIWNGVQLEPDARDLFQEMNNEEVIEVGFCTSKYGHSGNSPDGLIDGGEGLEIKCPSLATHKFYIERGVLPESYKNQVHFSMAVTGAKAWWFFSYSKFAPPFQVYVERDKFTEQMVDGIKRFSELFEKRLNQDIENEKIFEEAFGVKYE